MKLESVAFHFLFIFWSLLVLQCFFLGPAPRERVVEGPSYVLDICNPLHRLLIEAPLGSTPFNQEHQ